MQALVVGDIRPGLFRLPFDALRFPVEFVSVHGLLLHIQSLQVTYPPT
jgi:hypothetical protein